MVVRRSPTSFGAFGAFAACAALAALAACKSPQPCPSPLEECDGQCVDVQSDRRHCGFCTIACGFGEVCTGGSCHPDLRAPCSARAGGAFVTLGFDGCPGSTKLWVTEPHFVADAASYVGSTALPRTPVFSVLSGGDCDVEWSWHVADDTPAFVTTVTASGCDVCPQAVQASVAGFIATTGKWCPSDARVLAIEQR